MKRLILVLFSLYSIHCWADEDALSVVSPKLKQFVAGHATASQCLSNVLAEALSNRTMQVFYFYTEDERMPRSFHYYPARSVISISLRENQQPVDEFICFLFELLNSEGETEFEELAVRAQAGTIGRKEFAEQVIKKEFGAMKRTRDKISKLALSDKEKSDSQYYNRFKHCPDDFQEYMIYTEKIAKPYRDPMQEYMKKYDQLRQSKQ